MEANNEMLKVISNETIDSVHDINIVTPTIYKSLFLKNAASHEVDIKDESKITDELLDKMVHNFQTMQQETSQNAIKLSEHTNNAISAIKDKDESKLNQILKETKELRNEIEKLKEAVYKDELTHALNRKWLHDNFLKSDSDIFIKDGVLAIIDLNYFKNINDTFGHVIGDKVLIYIANQLKKIKERVIRYGGDEFIILFSKNTTENIALEKLNNLREDIILKKLKASNASFKVSFSVGVHQFQSGDSLTKIIESADKNMYDDKIKIKKRVTGI
jgi:diguanylate cyclase (GGDEF)-like protein